ncbi:tyrosine-type recombinase/integrase [Fictibacillus enclensis]|uniref:tyrosine-type recombinase/integrase n=1 Tax=Fictibacillus enclensis TaxID=1017270 RepID=UPI0025A053CB|nr:tyrosine-type recombinase/integrase [Fictibacillus enclensis]MDM5339697.1 tyrosine-type recombinase/integrase [Fictibacillus enclensis]
MPLKKRVKRTQTSSADYPQLTFEQAIDLVIAGKRAEGLRERTLKDYVKSWEYFVTWIRGNYDYETLDKLTVDVFRNYINYQKYDAKRYDGHKYISSDQQRVGLSDTTINIRLRVLKAVFNYLEREELIEVNPIEKVKLLRQDVDLTNCLSKEEIKELLRQPEQKDYVGFRDFVGMNLLLDSGLRGQEMLSLRTSDIDFQSRFITLSAEISKNRKPRLVPISAQVSKLLLQLISENRQHFKTDRIFLSCYGEPLGHNQFNKRLKYYGLKAGIAAKKMTCHVYRHTWAKNMILNGCDPFTLQKMGGWSDMRTMRRYIQMDTKDIRRSHDDFSPVMRLRGQN